MLDTPEQARAFIQNEIDRNRPLQLPKGHAVGDILVWDGDSWEPARAEVIRLVGNGSDQPAFKNAWAALAGWQAPGFYKDAFGIIHLVGALTAGTINTAAFTLPAKYRPAAKRRFPTVSNGAIGAIDVLTSGDVVPSIGANPSTFLDGIYFRPA